MRSDTHQRTGWKNEEGDKGEDHMAKAFKCIRLLHGGFL